MYSPGKSQFNDYQYQEGESDEKETVFGAALCLGVMVCLQNQVNAKGIISRGIMFALPHLREAPVKMGHNPAGREPFVSHIPFRRKEITGKFGCVPF